jgi:hypothetical protein
MAIGLDPNRHLCFLFYFSSVALDAISDNWYK